MIAKKSVYCLGVVFCLFGCSSSSSSSVCFDYWSENPTDIVMVSFDGDTPIFTWDSPKEADGILVHSFDGDEWDIVWEVSDLEGYVLTSPVTYGDSQGIYEEVSAQPLDRDHSYSVTIMGTFDDQGCEIGSTGQNVSEDNFTLP